MGRISLTVLAIAMATGQAASAQSVEQDAEKSKTTLRHCGPSEAELASSPDSDWALSKSVAERHTFLRGAVGEPMPAGRSMVTIRGVGGDMETTEYSVIVSRGDDGIWHGTAVGQSKIWVEGAKPTILPREAWTLPVEKGRRLDAILADKCYYAEPTLFGNKKVAAIGSLFITVETKTPERTRVTSYLGSNVAGLTNELTQLSFPPKN